MTSIWNCCGEGAHCQFSRCGLAVLPDPLRDDLDFLVTGGAWDVERAQDEGLALDQGGGAFEGGLANDGILGADAGFFFGEGGLFYLCTQSDAVEKAIDRSYYVEAYVEILDPGAWGGIVGP